MHSSQSYTVAVTVAVLATVFLSSLVLLLIICRHKLCMFGNYFGASTDDKERKEVQHEGFNVSRSDIHLISSQEMEDGDYLDGVDPDDLLIHPDLDKLVEAHRWKWVDDALGLVPHCLMMLKGCHLISERLVTTALASTDQHKFIELAMVAKSILPLVDDMLRCMCPPIDPRLLEVRASALLKAVTRLGKLTQRTCNVSWPSGIIDEMNSHYQHLKDISKRFESLQQTNEIVEHHGNVTIVESSLT